MQELALPLPCDRHTKLPVSSSLETLLLQVYSRGVGLFVLGACDQVPDDYVIEPDDTGA